MQINFRPLATMLVVLTLLSSLTLFGDVTSLEPRIVVAPESVNATLNSTAFFYCNGIGRLIDWTVDGHQQDTPEAKALGIKIVSPEDRELRIINSTLTIPATMDNDNITFSCSVFGDDGVLHSPAVLLKVQGLLDSVLNLAIVRADDYNHILTWHPPFTLDITDVNPDIITYTVCDNVTSSCQNTSDTRYVFPTLCDPVEITISAWNPVGEGERISIVHEPPDDVRRSTAITSLKSEVSFKSLSEPVVTLLLQVHVDGNCFDIFNIEFRGQYSGVSVIEIIPTVNGSGTAFLTFSENISADDFYTVTICEPETVIKLTTFDVQKEDVRKGSETINVTCVFARGSQAQGCHIVIQLVSEGPPHPPSMEAEALRRELANGELEREASTSFTDLEAGTYNVLIYDVGVDGEYNLEKSVYNELIALLEFSLLPTSSVTVMATVPPTVQTSSMFSPTLTAVIATGVFITVVTAIVVGAIIGVYIMKVKSNRVAAKKANKQQTETFPMRQNLSYEDSHALRVTRGPQPTDIKECSAYGVLNRQQ